LVIFIAPWQQFTVAEMVGEAMTMFNNDMTAMEMEVVLASNLTMAMRGVMTWV